jgi:hypothetical protein
MPLSQPHSSQFRDAEKVQLNKKSSSKRETSFSSGLPGGQQLEFTHHMANPAPASAPAPAPAHRTALYCLQGICNLLERCMVCVCVCVRASECVNSTRTSRQRRKCRHINQHSHQLPAAAKGTAAAIAAVQPPRPLLCLFCPVYAGTGIGSSLYLCVRSYSQLLFVHVLSLAGCILL